MPSASDTDYSRFYLRHNNEIDRGAWAKAQRTFATLKPHLPVDQTAKIIEIGPGNGAVLGLLQAAGYSNLEGWEVDKTLASRAADAGFPVIFVDAGQIDEQLLSHKCQVDCIILMHVLEHIDIDKLVGFLSSIERALRPGGKMFCEVPNAHSPIAAHWRYNDWTHKTLFSTESLECIFMLAGFADIAVGAAKPSMVVPRSVFFDLFMKLTKSVLMFLSHSIQRLHLVAELGVIGFSYPTGMAIFGIAHKGQNKKDLK